MLWWVLLDDYLAGFRIKNAGGADHKQDPNYAFDSLKASMSAKSATMEGPVEGLFTVSKKIGVAEGRGSSTGSTITILTP